MRKTFLLARSHLHKAKGQMTAIVVLILLASSMLNIWLMLAMDYRQNFDRYHDRLNAEHVTLALSSDDAGLRDYISRILDKDARTAEYCMDDSLFMVGSFPYNGGEINANIMVLNKQAADSRTVGKVEIVEEGGYESGIYLPMIYGTSGEYGIGDTFEMMVGTNQVNYTVCGFINSVMLGSHNCSMVGVLLTPDCYQELEETGYAPKATLVSVRLRDRAENESYEAMLNVISEEYPDVWAISNSYALVAQSRYISQMICSGIVSAMAFFVLLIALVIIASNLTNYIQENMRNFGALKALGYTSGQLVRSLLSQFLGIAMIAALTGAGLSYCIFPAINSMMIAQTGIPYAVRFLPLPLLYTLLILGGAVALTVWISSRRIRKADPIVALRQGVQTHSFKHNHVPLDKTQAPLHCALALKVTLLGMRQNFIVCITVAVLSLVVVFSGVITENMIADPAPFLNLIVGEMADSCINVNIGLEEDFLREMREDERVEKIYLFNQTGVEHVGELQLYPGITEDFADLNNQDLVFEGRFPRYDNEIAIAVKYAKEQGLKTGSEITLRAEGKEAVYIICGFTQISNYLGKDCLLTRSGYERMSTLQNCSYYLNLREDTDIDAFNEEIRDRYGSDINTVLNIQSIIEGSTKVYISLMTIIVMVVLLLGMIIIAFVLYLLVRTMLNHKKSYYGIMKALGFTTGQLILQTALSFMPAMILSTAAGLTVCCFIINPLTALFLRGIGIVKCTFTVPADYISIAGIGLVLFAFAAVCLLSLKIRKIAPETLLTGE